MKKWNIQTSMKQLGNWQGSKNWGESWMRCGYDKHRAIDRAQDSLKLLPIPSFLMLVPPSHIPSTPSVLPLILMLYQRHARKQQGDFCDQISCLPLVFLLRLLRGRSVNQTHQNGLRCRYLLLAVQANIVG